MPYILATEEEVTFDKSRYDFYPWAAGKPGGLFDSPCDILYSDGRYPTTELKDFVAKENLSFDVRSGSGVWLSGWYIKTSQTGCTVSLHHEDNGNFEEVFRCLDTLLPRILPVIVRVRNHLGYLHIKGQPIKLFEPTLSEYGTYTILFSGDTWLLTKTTYGSTTIVREDTDRQSFFRYVLENHGFCRNSENDDDDDYIPLWPND